MIDFSTLQGVTIPAGVVTQIERNGVVIWKVAKAGGPVILEVAKVTSDTYAGETTYTGEQFILLDIYPKTNGTVSVTYGGLTKAVTDTSGAEEPNAIQVFFGTFNGVSDSVETPASGTLTIDGDYYAFGQGSWSQTKSGLSTQHYPCVTEVISYGKPTRIPGQAFYKNPITFAEIPDGVTQIGMNAFYGTNIEKLVLPKSVLVLNDAPFAGCGSLRTVEVLATNPPTSVSVIGLNASIFGVVDSDTFVLERIIVPAGCLSAYKEATNWSVYADYIVEAS